MKDIRIAIDGPASSGKSTVAKIIAKNLGYTYLDTGAMYRSATYLALQNGLTEENVPEILDQLSQHLFHLGKRQMVVQKFMLVMLILHIQFVIIKLQITSLG